MGKKFLSIVDQMSAYGAYHRNAVNQLIHFFGVPAITLTLLMMLTKVSANAADNIFFTAPPAYPLLAQHQLFLPLVGGLGIFYILLHPMIGTLVALEMVGLWVAANHLMNSLGSEGFLYAVIGHVVGWVVQFIGHGVFEGTRPALVNNLLQTLLAPMFVVVEGLFFFGLYPSLKGEVQKASLAEYNRLFPGAKKVAKKTN